jgi:malate dehydrogenase
MAFTPPWRARRITIENRQSTIENRIALVPRGEEVAILGAGELGGALAHALARLDVVSVVRLIDAKSQVAAGKALDLTQAGPIEAFATVVTSAAEPLAAAGASVVVVADQAGGTDWQGDEALLLLKHLARASQAVIVCASSSHRPLIDDAVRVLHLPRERIFGSAPEAMAAAARAMVALETGGSPTEVGLTVLGAPPEHMVVPWEEATIGGLAAARALDEPARRRVSARLAALWPPGPHALAAAAAGAVDALVGRSRRVISAFVAQREGAADRTRTVALPVRLGPGGVTRIEVPALNARDRVVLDNAMLK